MERRVTRGSLANQNESPTTPQALDSLNISNSSAVVENGSAVSSLPLNSPVNIEPTIGGGLSSKLPS